MSDSSTVPGGTSPATAPAQPAAPNPDGASSAAAAPAPPAPARPAAPAPAAAPAEGDDGGEPAGPCTLVIFGASGDLTKRKLLPALLNLGEAGLLPHDFAIVGVARRGLTHEVFRQQLNSEIGSFATGPIDQGVWQDLLGRIYYLSGNFDDAGTFRRLHDLLGEVDEQHNTRGNHLYYMATSPEYFAEVVDQLGAVGMTRETNGQWRRVVVEKPFGRDYDSARTLNAQLLKTLQEHQIYRIDHYLGKETVQNIMVFRFANGIFEPIWNRNYIDHVQITVGETVGVETRGGYYDTAGALRDMVPNHIFQLITLTAMEPPVSFEADAVRSKQVEIINAMKPLSPENVLEVAVRGQYGPGTVDGKPVPGYREEEGVSPTSATETYVAMKLQIDNWRWAGVPFYLRTGKRLPTRATEIAIGFKRAPHMLFRKTPVERLHSNLLVLHIQPGEGISLRFEAKRPGPIVRLSPVDMDFAYQNYFGGSPETGYERLLYDAMVGDATLFQRADQVEAAWGVVEPVLDVWHALPPRSFPNYAAGTWGPPEADNLLLKDGRRWRTPGQ